MGEHSIVSDWLRTLQLDQYAESFIDNGYDDLEICKQIGEPDLDAIGVGDAAHRRLILQAVKTLLEHGATAVYFTLEENASVTGNLVLEQLQIPAESPPNDVPADGPQCQPTVSPSSPVPARFADEYEEGKAELLKYPHMQLKGMISDKLARDGIRLSAEPYTSDDGSGGHMEALAIRYAEELRTHLHDVADRLEELRRRRVAIDFPPLPLELDLSAYSQSRGFKPGKYSPSSCLSDHEEQSIYGFYQGAAPPRPVPTAQRFLSSRSRYFYEPCPFPAYEGTEHGDRSKKRGGLGRLFRSLGNRKDKDKHSPRHGSKLGTAKLYQFLSPLKHHDNSRPLPRLMPGEAFLGDEEWVQLMMVVRDGHLTMEEAVQRIRQREAERQKLKGWARGEVLSDLSRGTRWTASGKKLHDRGSAIFYTDSLPASVAHIYYEPPPDEADRPQGDLTEGARRPPYRPCAVCTAVRGVPARTAVPAEGSEAPAEGHAYSPEEFGSAVLDRIHHQGTEACPGNCGNIMCSVTGTLSDTSPTACPVAEEPAQDAPVHAVAEEPNPTTNTSPAERRPGKGVLGKLRNLTNRNSYSTSEEGQSQSSDYEEQEEVERRMESRLSRDHAGRSSSSSLVGRVRELHRDVKWKISRLRKSRALSESEQLPDGAELQDDTLRPGLSVDSLPSSSSSSVQAQTPTSSNRSSTSAGEDDTSPGIVGPILGCARALVDYTPSPYDRDALAFKKGDIIDIIAKSNTGIWFGMTHGRVGHFKFINVEEISGDSKPRRRRLKRLPEWPSKSDKPHTLEEALRQAGLQDYLNVLALNGYEDMDSFKDIDKEDLESLGINIPDHQGKLLRVAEMLSDFEELPCIGTPMNRETVPETACDPTEETVARRHPTPASTSCTSGDGPHRKRLSHHMQDDGELLCDSKETDDVSQPNQSAVCDETLENAINNLGVNTQSCLSSSCSDSGSSSNVVARPTALPRSIAPGYHPNILPLQLGSSPPNAAGDSVSAYSKDHSSSAGIRLGTRAFSEHFLQDENREVGEFLGSSLRTSKFQSVSTELFADERVQMPIEPLPRNSRGKMPPPVPKRTTPFAGADLYPGWTRAKESSGPLPSNRFDGTFGDSASEDSPVHLSCGPVFAKKVKSATLPRKKPQECNGSVTEASDRVDPVPVATEKKGFRRFGHRKGSLQPTSKVLRPPSISLLTVATKKLEDENIDLCQYPYTDRTGFCGIPPALVQRYAEELQRDVYDMAEALDQARINALQHQGRRGVPNDFLADSCNGPVVEANSASLYDWLVSLGLPMYRDLFNHAGYHHIDQVTGLRDSDLRKCGITNPRHLRLLSTAIGTLHLCYREMV